MNEIIITTISKSEIKTLIEDAFSKAMHQKIVNDKNQVDTFLTVDHAAAFIGIAKATLYGKCSDQLIPTLKKRKEVAL